MKSIVFYTNRFIGDGFAGCARGPFIFIRPEHKGDAGLLAHEQMHVKQWIRTLGMHSVMYALSASYRLKSEVEAYKRQMWFCVPDMADKFAGFISTKYNIQISKEDALKALKDKA